MSLRTLEETWDLPLSQLRDRLTGGPPAAKPEGDPCQELGLLTP